MQYPAYVGLMRGKGTPSDWRQWLRLSDHRHQGQLIPAVLLFAPDPVPVPAQNRKTKNRRPEVPKIQNPFLDSL